MGKPIGAGARVRLIRCDEKYTRLALGDEGTCTGLYTDDTGMQKVEVQWDSGSNLSLLQGIDDYVWWWPYTGRQSKK